MSFLSKVLGVAIKPASKLLGSVAKPILGALGLGQDTSTADALSMQTDVAKQQALLSANSDVQNVTQFTDNSTGGTLTGSSDMRNKRKTSGFGVNVLNI